MATLFERIIGADGSKIPIHGVRALAGEVYREKRTPADLVSAFELDADQTNQLYLFLSKLASHPDPVYLGVVLFDWLALAEIGYIPEVYRDEAQFWARIDAEIAHAQEG